MHTKNQNVKRGADYTVCCLQNVKIPPIKCQLISFIPALSKWCTTQVQLLYLNLQSMLAKNGQLCFTLPGNFYAVGKFFVGRKFELGRFSSTCSKMIFQIFEQFMWLQLTTNYMAHAAIVNISMVIREKKLFYYFSIGFITSVTILLLFVILRY